MQHMRLVTHKKVSANMSRQVLPCTLHQHQITIDWFSNLKGQLISHGTNRHSLTTLPLRTGPGSRQYNVTSKYFPRYLHRQISTVVLISTMWPPNKPIKRFNHWKIPGAVRLS